eukprot:TRINITY_DN5677_c0_g1_i2.p1 TRINITY_DN5677_c0_g1~~TRINITY_DN5677_c0_g1_i2.p1  ORF type:complete len:730 (+),score=158.94 TRINITY_DN5677_c0_g1_i2:9-2198(+)
MLKLIFVIFLLISYMKCFNTDEYWKEIIMNTPSPQLIEEYLKNYTSEPHLAGTIYDYNTAVYTRDMFQSFGLDSEIIELDAIIPYIISRSVSMYSTNEDDNYNCTLEESPFEVDPTSNNSHISLTYTGYSPSGSAEAELVYANYGRLEDFEYLDKMNISVKDRIVITRFGKVGRAAKVLSAQLRGALGVLLYSDPYDDGYFVGDTYPNGPYRPPTGVQEGSSAFANICPGNPDQQRLDQLCIKQGAAINSTLPQILIQPIGYGDASYLLKNLDGPPVNLDWQGALSFHYHIGGTPTTRVRMEIVSNITTTPVWNVRAYVNGTEEGNKIMIGNHRDAWVFGAVDPSSGSSCLLEIGRTLATLRDNGWKPRRTIVLSSWDGEEQAMIGSTWDAETNIKDYNETLLAYLNVDTAVSMLNPPLTISASPVLRSVIREASKLVIDPNTQLPLSQVWDGSFGILGSGSDYVSFLDHLGVSSVDFQFGTGVSGAYHSRYDSFYWMKNFGDPNFQYHKAMTQFVTLITYMISSNSVLPFNHTDTSVELETSYRSIKTLLAENFGKNENYSKFNFKSFEKSLNLFLSASHFVNDEIAKYIKANYTDPLPQKVDSLNNMLFMTERYFLDPKGLPNRPWFKHVMQAPGYLDGYGSIRFPSIYEAIQEKDFARALDQFHVVQSRIDAATEFMKKDLEFSTDTEFIVLATFGALIVFFIFVFIGYTIYKKRKVNLYQKFDND